MSKTWLKVWIVIGAVAAAAVLFLPPVLARVASKDVQRYRECVEGRRTDCRRSIVWNLVDVSYLLQQQSGAQLTGLLFDPFNTRGLAGAVRTSEKSPFIEKAEPRGMSNTNGVYFAPGGTDVTFVATITGVIVDVDLYVVELEGDEIKRPEKRAAFRRTQGDIWETTYRLPHGFNGSIEIRAYGIDPKDMAVLALPVAAR